MFAVIDAGSFAEKQDKLNEYIKGYQLNPKKRDRKISSGMIIGVKTELSCSFKIIKEMTNSDRLEAVSLNVWKSKKKFPCVIIYNPPNNIGCFDVLPIEENCIFFGDFNMAECTAARNFTNIENSATCFQILAGNFS